MRMTSRGRAASAIAVRPSVRVSIDHPFVAFAADLDSDAILLHVGVVDLSISQP
jgi:hypothetical protein